MRTFLLIICVWGTGLAQSVPEAQSKHISSPSGALTCAVVASQLPMDAQVDDTLVGINTDYWRAIRTRLGLDMHCDPLPSAQDVSQAMETHPYDFVLGMQTIPGQDASRLVSQPYAQYPYVVVAHKEAGLIYDMSRIGGKRMAISRQDALTHAWKQAYPAVTILRVDSPEAALESVRHGEAFVAVGSLPVMAQLLNQNLFEPLKIAGTLPEKVSLQIMVRPERAAWIPRINDAIEAIPRSERLAIDTRWIQTYKENFFLSKNFYAILGILVTLLIWLYYRSHTLKREISHKEIDMQRLEELASVDGLTMVCNRQTVDRILALHLAGVERYRGLLSVVFFDIDYFKQINDHYGHNVGDDVLVELTKLVSGFIRESDILGRWGGDEFLIILPETSKRQAKRLAESIRTLIREHTFEHIGHLRCSFGAESYRFGDTLKSLMDRVDTELYEDKKHKEPWRGSSLGE